MLGAKSAWLVAVEHLTPDAEHDEHWSATSADSDGERYVPMLRMQHDGVFIWALSENGDFDLAH
ncbi:MAG: hypothetical protein JWO36_3769 [Myxococcales bacterium]|nr:hypothetical protein [Myxococcales bacterium]